MVNDKKAERLNLFIDSNTMLFIDELSTTLKLNKSVIVRMMIMKFKLNYEDTIYDLIEKNKLKIDDLDKYK